MYRIHKLEKKRESQNEITTVRGYKVQTDVKVFGSGIRRDPDELNPWILLVVIFSASCVSAIEWRQYTRSSELAAR